jgi:peptidoglycan/LPS O-acetylase OafA/YrhL
MHAEFSTKANMQDATKFRRDIQTLRGLAVSSVILYHANETFFPLGYLGVDVFFVISGFVVTKGVFSD